MAAVMRDLQKKNGRVLAGCFLLALAAICLPSSAGAQDAGRLQELLYGEALFHSHQQDYLSAISRLQLAEEQGLLPASSDSTRLLLARMKLAYGMHLEAGFDLHALPPAGTTAATMETNRAWYELSRAFYYKGYQQAALESLNHIQGNLPVDIAGDHQLLLATLLMSLGRNSEAAQELAEWRGTPDLAAYAYYNRGIALVRSGDHEAAVPVLERAVELPASGEELLALRDKARLSLGYVFANRGQYKRASRLLQAVRPDGPFSNRALLALGWIDYKQGRSESALISWTELRGRSSTDPAVLETLLIVPAVHRELESVQAATRDYEAARQAFTSELDSLQEARESVQHGRVVSQLLRDNSHAGPGEGGTPGQGAARFFGPLLASKDFRQMMQDHGELQSMLDALDRGLQDVDVLAKALPGAGPAGPAPGDASPVAVDPQAVGLPGSGDPAQLQGQAVASKAGADVTQEWVERQGPPEYAPPAEIPRLPEIESPARRPVKPLPGSGVPRSRPVPRFAYKPPPSEMFGLPQSEILYLPESGEFFGRPKSGEFFRRPGQEKEEDYAYPDTLPKRASTPGRRYGYRLSQLLPQGEEESGFNPAAVPVGQALRELAAALNNSTLRMARLGRSFDPALDDAGLLERVLALRARILRLRQRIAHAIALHESYTQALALDELDRRQYLLEDLLEQASLELAKTYDQSSDE